MRNRCDPLAAPSKPHTPKGGSRKRQAGLGLAGIAIVAATAGVGYWWTADPLSDAESAFGRADYHRALRIARAQLSRSPSDDRAHLWAARCLFKLKRFDQSEEHYQLAGRDLSRIDDLQDRAYGLTLLGRASQAKEIYEQILTISPESVLALKRLAAVYMSLKEWAPVLALADQLGSIRRGEVAAATLAGIAHHELKHYSEAVTAGERVLQIDPDLREMPLPKSLFWNNLALDLMAIGRTREARDYLAAALERLEDANLMELLGLAYSQEGATDLAERSWKQAITWDPRNADAALGLGRLALGRNRPSEAVVWLQMAVQASPNALEPVYGLARAYRSLGNVSEAERLERMAGTIRASQPFATGSGGRFSKTGDSDHRTATAEGSAP
jgi:tetratricopeptide (TPR) repeat protein